MPWLERTVLRRLVRRNPDQWTWLSDLAAKTSGVLWKFGAFGVLATHRRHAPPTLVHIVRLAAMQVYDCGACLQIAVESAVRDGVPPEVIRQALEGGNGLCGADALAYRYGRAIASDDPALPDLIETASADLGGAVLGEMAIAAATAGVFSLTKRGLGIAVSCQKMEIAVR